MTDSPTPDANAPVRRPRFLTMEQVAEELTVGVPAVRGLIKTGELRGIQVGARNFWRIGSRDVEDFIAEAYRRTRERIDAGDLPEPDPDEPDPDEPDLDEPGDRANTDLP